MCSLSIRKGMRSVIAKEKERAERVSEKDWHKATLNEQRARKSKKKKKPKRKWKTKSENVNVSACECERLLAVVCVSHDFINIVKCLFFACWFYAIAFGLGAAAISSSFARLHLYNIKYPFLIIFSVGGKCEQKRATLLFVGSVSHFVDGNVYF